MEIIKSKDEYDVIVVGGGAGGMGGLGGGGVTYGGGGLHDRHSSRRALL